MVRLAPGSGPDHQACAVFLLYHSRGWNQACSSKEMVQQILKLMWESKGQVQQYRGKMRLVTGQLQDRKLNALVSPMRPRVHKWPEYSA